MKFLVDVSISPKTVEFLKKNGYEAVRISELGMANLRMKKYSITLLKKI